MTVEVQRNVTSILSILKQGETGATGSTTPADGSVTTPKLATGAVTADKIGTSEVTESKILAGAVTTTKIADSAVERSKASPKLDFGHSTNRRTISGSARWLGMAALQYTFPVFAVSVAIIGDSHTVLGWHAGLTRRMRRKWNQRAVPATSAYSGTWFPACGQFGVRGATTGGVADTAGPMGYSTKLPSIGNTWQLGHCQNTLAEGYTFYGVGSFTVDVLYDSAPSGETPNPGTTVILQTANITLTAGQSWKSNQFAAYANQHQKIVLRVTATTTNAQCWGGFVHYDNYYGGSQTWAFGHSGWDGANIPNTEKVWDMIASIAPSLIILAMGTNEESAANYETNTQAAIDEAKIRSPLSSIALWFPHMASLSGDDELWWDDAHDRFYKLCRDNDCIPIDLYSVMGDLADPYDTQGFSDDNTHFNDLGAEVASTIASVALLGEDPLARPADLDNPDKKFGSYILMRNRGGTAATSDLKILAGNDFSGGDYFSFLTEGNSWAGVAFANPVWTSGQAGVNAGSAERRYRRQGIFGSTGTLYSSFDRHDAKWIDSAELVSGTLHLIFIPITNGQVITSLTFYSGATALASGTNQWACVLSPGRVSRRFSNNDTSGAWAANSPKTFTLTSTYQTVVGDVDGLYVGLMIAATTPPSLMCHDGNATMNGIAPILNGRSNTGQTTVPGSLNPATAITARAVIPYVEIK